MFSSKGSQAEFQHFSLWILSLKVLHSAGSIRNKNDIFYQKLPESVNLLFPASQSSLRAKIHEMDKIMPVRGERISVLIMAN